MMGLIVNLAYFLLGCYLVLLGVGLWKLYRSIQVVKLAHASLHNHVVQLGDALSFLMSEMEGRESPDGGVDWIPADYPVFGVPPEGNRQDPRRYNPDATSEGGNHEQSE